MKKLFVLILGIALVGFCSCGSSSGSGDSESSSGTTTVTENPLSVTFPQDLAVTSPLASSTVAPGNVSKTFKSITKGEAETGQLVTYEDRKQELQGMLEADTVEGCKFTISLFMQSPEANCYGPNLEYHNHPNGTDEIRTGETEPTLPGGDTGLWADYNFAPNPTSGINESTGEACAAAKLNSLVSNVSFKVDSAMNMFAGMLCVANIEGTSTLPAIGEAKDYTDLVSTLVENISEVTITVTTATITREADLVDGANSYEVYLSHVAATVSDGENSAIVDVYLKHIPKNADNTIYKGKLWYTIKSETGLPAGTPNCSMGEANAKQVASSVLYEKDAEGDLSYHLRSASYCSTDVDPFDENHNVDATKMHTEGQDQPPDGPPSDQGQKAAADYSDGWAGNFNIGTFLLHSDNTALVSFAWQAGPQDGWTRTFIMNLTTGGDAAAGCGYFGFGPAVNEDNTGSITGFICNWAGPNNDMGNGANRATVEKVQEQCMLKDATTGMFAPTSSHIKYAPADSCDVSAGSEDFVFWSGIADSDKTAVPATIVNNDKRDAGLFTNELLDMTASIPPAPPSTPSDIE